MLLKPRARRRRARAPLEARAPRPPSTCSTRKIGRPASPGSPPGSKDSARPAATAASSSSLTTTAGLKLPASSVRKRPAVPERGRLRHHACRGVPAVGSAAWQPDNVRARMRSRPEDVLHFSERGFLPRPANHLSVSAPRERSRPHA